VSLTPKKRAELFNMFKGKCAYCGCDLPAKGWHADHIEPIIRGGKFVPVENHGYTSYKYVQNGKCERPENNRDDNYYPSCRSCNINKSSCGLELWRKCLERVVEGMRRDHASFRHAERFGLVKEAETKVVFYFEKFQKVESEVA